MDYTHALAATTRRGFDDYRITDPGGCFDDRSVVVRQHAIGARQTGDSGLLHVADCRDFVTHKAYGFRGGSDENKATLFDSFGEVGIFGQKTIARMDRDRIGHLSSCDYSGNIEIAFGCLGWADADRFVGQSHIFAVAVSVRV